MSNIASLLIACTFMTSTMQEQSAKRILDKLSTVFEQYESIEIELHMVLKYPERQAEEQDVIFIQKSPYFYLKSEAQEIFGDGSSVWLYLIARNEVQINDYEEDDDLSMITPKNILRQYKSGKYDYRLIKEDRSNAEIEFKPLEDSEYSKFRIDVDLNRNTIKSISSFAKDGTQIHLNIKHMLSNKIYPEGFFSFNPKNYPNVFVEDLRID